MSGSKKSIRDTYKILQLISSECAVINREGDILYANPAWKSSAANIGGLGTSEGENFFEEFSRVLSASTSEVAEALLPDEDHHAVVGCFESVPIAEFPEMLRVSRIDAEGEDELYLVTTDKLSSVDRTKVVTARIPSFQPTRDHFELMLDALDVVVWAATLDGDRYLYINSAVEKIYGRPRSEFENDSLLWLKCIHTSDRERAERGIKEFLENGSAELSYRIVQPGGAVRWIRDRKIILHDEKGKALCMGGIATDITEHHEALKALEESENKFRTLFEDSQDVIFFSTPEGHFLDINRAGLEMFGMNSLKEMQQGQMARDIYADPADRARFLEALERDGRVDKLEVRLRHKDGTEIYAQESAQAVIDEQGKMLQIRGILRDITQQKLLEQQLYQTQKMEAIGTLAGGIAHDFNNILAALLGYIELTMEELEKDSRARSNLEQAYTAGMRGRDLVSQILAFSYKSDRQYGGVNLSAIVREALKLLRATLPSTIEIRSKLDDRGRKIIGDASQVHQIILNLCTNAAHAMRGKGGLLTVELKEVQFKPDGRGRYGQMPVELSADSYLRLRVRDTGEGIPPEILPRIFDPFFTTKPKGVGTGMGLSVVHGIMRNLAGAITVSSEPGEGSVFDAYFPCAGKQETKTAKKSEPIAAGHGERVLLVDDEEVLVDVHARLLERLGYEVSGFSNCVEALTEFTQRPGDFDLVITDQTMPSMTGAQLAQKIKKIRPEVPVIIITGFSEVLGPAEARKMGVAAFLSKPLLSEDLAAAVSRVLKTSGSGQ